MRRVHQLLVSSLTKLQKWPNSDLQHNESLSTLEKLAILKAWAQVYIVAKSSSNENLLSLVQPQLMSLSKYWFAALRDYALISLPSQFSSQLPRDGGSFYTNDTVYSCRAHYLSLWPSILHAAALWLTTNSDTSSSDDNNQISDDNRNIHSVNTINDKFHLLFGICMKTLSTPNMEYEGSFDKIMQCLQGLNAFVCSEWAQTILISDRVYPIELCSVLYRLLMLHDDHTAQILAIQIIMNICDALQKQIDQSEQTLSDNDIISIIEPIICVTFGILVRHFPQIQPRISASLGIVVGNNNDHCTQASNVVIATVFQMLERIPQLCTSGTTQSIEIVCMILYLVTEVIRQYATKTSNHNYNANTVPIQALLQCLRTISSHATKQHVNDEQWTHLLKSALAKIISYAKISK